MRTLLTESDPAWLTLMAVSVAAALLLLIWARASARRRAAVVLLPFLGIAVPLAWLGWPPEMVALCGIWFAIFAALLWRFAGLG